MNYLIKLCDRYGILRNEIDYHVLRASMVLMFLFFGYQKWFEYEAQALIPYISNGPLISWNLFLRKRRSRAPGLADNTRRRQSERDSG